MRETNKGNTMNRLLPRIFHGVRRRLSKQSFGLDELDVKLAKIIQKDGGFFIEAGGNDGVRQSNTLYFEKYKRWRGLLIEPVPELYERCKTNRPKCIVENFALVSRGYTNKTVRMTYCDLMTVVKGGMCTEAEEIAHLEAGRAVQGVKTYELEVPATTLQAIADRHNIREVDLLSLDVEGYELNVLRGLDLNRLRPVYILVEARNPTAVNDFLLQWYEMEARLSHHDVLYRRK
jgi:FkbM family methyltransferase